ncbi:MAG TPA: hypothetical protein VN851_06310 [Thermoanaerobaculia bacterium]|nr:hypothetical protein [Thermoanaerobaculia bacterium]
MKIATSVLPRRASIALLLLLGIAFGATAQNAPPRVSARSLVSIAGNALIAVQQAASADARLGANPQRIAPFWASLQGANQTLAEVGAGLGGPGRPPADDLFTRVARAGGRIAELSAAWERIGIPNAGVQAGLATLRTSWALFRGTYGPEGVRHRQDRPLSADEAHRLDVVRRAQEQLARQLERLEAKARRAHQVEEARRLAKFRARAQSSLLGANDLDAYLNALAALPEIEGEWAAIKAAAPKAQRAAYAAVDPIVEEIQTEAEIGSVKVLDLDQGKAWNFLEQSTELPESLAAAASELESPDADEEDAEAETEAADSETTADESEIPCADDDEECLAAEEAAAAATVSAEGEGEGGATPTTATTTAGGTTPEAAPPFPGTCGDSSADGCVAAPEVPVPQASPAAAPPPKRNPGT